MIPNNIGKIVENVWKSLSNHHPVKLDIFQVMPNHLHGILRVKPVSVVHAQPMSTDETGIARNAPTGCDYSRFGHVVAGTLSCIIRSFKSETTKQIRCLINNPNIQIWQRNFYEHIIRNENELNKIREYIIKNPLLWNRDRNNPKNLL